MVGTLIGVVAMDTRIAGAWLIVQQWGARIYRGKIKLAYVGLTIRHGLLALAKTIEMSQES